MLARCHRLLLWNRRELLTWSLIRRIFIMPPGKGNILQGLRAGIGRRMNERATMPGEVIAGERSWVVLCIRG